MKSSEFLAATLVVLGFSGSTAALADNWPTPPCSELIELVCPSGSVDACGIPVQGSSSGSLSNYHVCTSDQGPSSPCEEQVARLCGVAGADACSLSPWGADTHICVNVPSNLTKTISGDEANAFIDALIQGGLQDRINAPGGERTGFELRPIQHLTSNFLEFIPGLEVSPPRSA